MLTEHFAVGTPKCQNPCCQGGGFLRARVACSSSTVWEERMQRAEAGNAVVFTLFVPEILWKSLECPGEHITPPGSHTLTRYLWTSLLEVAIIILK